MSARGVAITRAEHSASNLRGEAAATWDAAAARRMLAVGLVLEGQPRGVAARICGMDRQTLCDWAHRFGRWPFIRPGRIVFARLGVS